MILVKDSTEYLKEILNEESKRSIQYICANSWRWQSNNPGRYSK